MSSSSNKNINEKLAVLQNQSPATDFSQLALNEIFSYLTPEELGRLAVNKHWRNAANISARSTGWKDRLKEQHPDKYAVLADQKNVQWYQEYVAAHQSAYSHCVNFTLTDNGFYNADRARMSAAVRILFFWIKSNDYKAWIARRCSNRDLHCIADANGVSQFEWAQRLSRQEILDYIFQKDERDVISAIECHQPIEIIESLSEANEALEPAEGDTIFDSKNKAKQKYGQDVVSPLHLAAAANNLSFIKHLLAKYPALIETYNVVTLYRYSRDYLDNRISIRGADKYSESPLILAAMHGHWDIVLYFLKNRQANPNLEGVRKREFRKAIYAAIQHEANAVVINLLAYNQEKELIKDVPSLLRQCMNVAVRYGNSDIMRFLLRQNPALRNIELGNIDEEGGRLEMPLVVAVSRENQSRTERTKAAKTVKLLLEQENPDFILNYLNTVLNTAQASLLPECILEIVYKINELSLQDNQSNIDQRYAKKLHPVLQWALFHGFDDLAFEIANTVIAIRAKHPAEDAVPHPVITVATSRHNHNGTVIKRIFDAHPEAYQILTQRQAAEPNNTRIHVYVQQYLTRYPILQHLKKLSLSDFADDCRKNREVLLNAMDDKKNALLDMLGTFDDERSKMFIEVLNEEKKLLNVKIDWIDLARVFNELSNEKAKKLAGVFFKDLKEQRDGDIYTDFVAILSPEKLAIYDEYLAEKRPRMVQTIKDVIYFYRSIRDNINRDVILDKMMADLIVVTADKMLIQDFRQHKFSAMLAANGSYKAITELLPTHKNNIYCERLIDCLIGRMVRATVLPQEFKEFLGNLDLPEDKKDQYVKQALPKLVNSIKKGGDYPTIVSNMSMQQKKELWDALVAIRACNAQQYENILKVLPAAKKGIFEESCKVIDKPVVGIGCKRRGSFKL